jgi:hypothetical protein
MEATPSTSERWLAKRLTEDGHPPVEDPEKMFSFVSGFADPINRVAWKRRLAPASGGSPRKNDTKSCFS